MMEVLAVIGTVVWYSVQNIFVKDYQNRCGVGIVQSLWFTAIKSIFTVILFWALNCFTLYVTGPTALFSFLFSVGAIFSVWGLIAAMVLGKMARVSMYALIGSALVPFFYGACFLGEDLSTVKAVAILLMCLSFFPSVYAPKNNRTALPKKARIRFIVLCIICFVSNGFCSLFLKLNQITAGASGANDFSAVQENVSKAVSRWGFRPRRFFTGNGRAVDLLLPCAGALRYDFSLLEDILWSLAVVGTAYLSEPTLRSHRRCREQVC